MKEVIEFTVRLIQAVKRTYARKWSFLGLFVLLFLVSIIVLGLLDLLPSTKSDLVLGLPETRTMSGTEASVVASTPVISVELPTKIEIPAINLSVAITNPITTDIAILDQALLKGAVRYPTSAKLGEVGNVVLFGHSSYLPVVGNQAYKAFNNIKKLVEGDTIVVYSSSTVYTYRVRTVEKKVATDDGIPLSTTDRVLTLTTCNSFGNPKENRFVVTADFVESHP